MWRQSLSPAYTIDFLTDVLNAFNTNPSHALISTPELHLWANPTFNPTPRTAGSLFAASEATFSGYAAQALTPSGVVLLNPNLPGIVADGMFETTDTDPFVPNQVQGYWVEGTLGIILFEKFPDDQIVEIGQYGDFLHLDVALPMEPNQQAS